MGRYLVPRLQIAQEDFLGGMTALKASREQRCKQCTRYV